MSISTATRNVKQYKEILERQKRINDLTKQAYQKGSLELPAGLTSLLGMPSVPSTSVQPVDVITLMVDPVDINKVRQYLGETNEVKDFDNVSSKFADDNKGLKNLSASAFINLWRSFKEKNPTLFSKAELVLPSDLKALEDERKRLIAEGKFDKKIQELYEERMKELKDFQETKRDMSVDDLIKEFSTELKLPYKVIKDELKKAKKLDKGSLLRLDAMLFGKKKRPSEQTISDFEDFIKNYGEIVEQRRKDEERRMEERKEQPMIRLPEPIYMTDELPRIAEDAVNKVRPLSYTEKSKIVDAIENIGKIYNLEVGDKRVIYDSLEGMEGLRQLEIYYEILKNAEINALKGKPPSENPIIPTEGLFEAFAPELSKALGETKEARIPMIRQGLASLIDLTQQLRKGLPPDSSIKNVLKNILKIDGENKTDEEINQAVSGLKRQYKLDPKAFVKGVEAKIDEIQNELGVRKPDAKKLNRAFESLIKNLSIRNLSAEEMTKTLLPKKGEIEPRQKEKDILGKIPSPKKLSPESIIEDANSVIKKMKKAKDLFEFNNILVPYLNLINSVSKIMDYPILTKKDRDDLQTDFSLSWDENKGQRHIDYIRDYIIVPMENIISPPQTPTPPLSETEPFFSPTLGLSPPSLSVGESPKEQEPATYQASPSQSQENEPIEEIKMPERVMDELENLNDKLKPFERIDPEREYQKYTEARKLFVPYVYNADFYMNANSKDIEYMKDLLQKLGAPREPPAFRGWSTEKKTNYNQFVRMSEILSRANDIKNNLIMGNITKNDIEKMYKANPNQYRNILRKLVLSPKTGPNGQGMRKHLKKSKLKSSKYIEL